MRARRYRRGCDQDRHAGRRRSAIGCVCDVLEARPRRSPLVVDPVMVAKGGQRLLASDAVSALKRRLLPLATLLTPNIPGSRDAGRHGDHRPPQAMRHAAEALLTLGAAGRAAEGRPSAGRYGHRPARDRGRHRGIRRAPHRHAATPTGPAARSRARSRPGWRRAWAFADAVAARAGLRAGGDRDGAGLRRGPRPAEPCRDGRSRAVRRRAPSWRTGPKRACAMQPQYAPLFRQNEYHIECAEIVARGLECISVHA